MLAITYSEQQLKELDASLNGLSCAKTSVSKIKKLIHNLFTKKESIKLLPKELKDELT